MKADNNMNTTKKILAIAVPLFMLVGCYDPYVLDYEYSGVYVANQYDLVFENGIGFQSYGTLIAFRMNGYLYLTDYHDYSKTTSKYCTEWTGFSTKERRAGLECAKFIKVVED